MTSKWLGTLVVTAVLFAAQRPSAAGNLEEAKAAFAAGKAAYERGDYDAALVQFQRANLIQPAPSLSFNIGMTYQRVGRNRDAVTAFERYITLTGTPQNPQEQQFQDNLKTRIATLRSRPDGQVGQVNQPRQEYQPPPPNPQYNYYQQPYQQPYPNQGGQPYYYPPPNGQYGYMPVISPQQRREMARKKRSTGIGLLVSGLVLDVVGIVMVAADAGTDFKHGDGVIAGFGVVFILGGTVMWPIGLSMMIKGSKEMEEAGRLPPAPQALAIPDGRRQASLEPATFVFHLPAFRF